MYSSIDGLPGLLVQLQTIRNLEIQRQVDPGRTSPSTRPSSRGRKARSMSPSVAQQYQQTQASLLSRRRVFRPRSTRSRSISACRPRSRCGSTIRPSTSSSSTTSGWTRMRDAHRGAAVCSSLQNDELPRAELADVARQLQKMYDELETIHDLVVARIAAVAEEARRDAQAGL